MNRPLASAISTRSFACLQHYQRQGPEVCEPDLLLLDLPPWITRAVIVDQGSPGKALIEFVTRDRAGKPVDQPVLSEESAFAELLIRTCLGETAFIDWTDGSPYLKVFGSRDSSAGIIQARILARVADGDAVRYLNGNTLDICACNLLVGPGASIRTPVDVMAHTLFKDIPERFSTDFESFKLLVRQAEDRYDGLHGHEITRK